MTAHRQLRFTGPFDARAGSEVEQMAAFLGRRTPSTGAGTVLIDLGRVTRFDPVAVQSLNRAWRVLIERGWGVEVAPPEPAAARLPFVAAAIRGDLEWARGSSSEAPTARRRDLRAR